jgi:asparagine synthase (glutamine-hydrolysing)
MCGIAGMMGVSVDRAVLERMAAALRHRGPDDHGTWTANDGRVGFGHARLAIIDLSAAGHQPMIDHGATLTIALNGEIYNYRDLRRELEELGHRFESESDTEVLLAGYRQWGADVLPRLVGMFAFAIHDSVARKVLLARDRGGEKPLYVARVGEGWWFASELKALATEPRFSRAIDPAALELFLAYGYVPADFCIYRNATKIRQGEAMLVDLESGTSHRWFYWRLPDPPDGTITTSAADLEDDLERLLEASVRRQLVADVPVGVLLSGGVDSSLVTAMAARVSSTPVTTFTISFPGGGSYDESAYARLVARHFGTNHIEMPAEAASIELLPILARQFDEPIGDSSMLPTYLVSQLVRRHATVALGGDGGDELFAGYDHYSWLMRRERMERRIPSLIRTIGGTVAARILPSGLPGRNHVIGFAGNTGSGIAHINLMFDQVTRNRLLRPLRRSCAPPIIPEKWRAGLATDGSLLRRATETDFRSTMVDGYLVKVDRASMLNSLEVRAPFLDCALIEFAFGRVPDALKATETERKILTRRLARRLLPAELDIDRKQGFAIPMSAWFRGPLGTLIESVLRDASRDIFDAGTIRRLITGQRMGLRNGQRLFMLTMFELWRREYGATL